MGMTNSATATKTTVAIYLDKEPIHVHAIGCGDNQKYRGSKPWNLRAATISEIVTAIYPPADFEYDGSDPAEIASLAAGLKIFPCVTFPAEDEHEGEVSCEHCGQTIERHDGDWIHQVEGDERCWPSLPVYAFPAAG